MRRLSRRLSRHLTVRPESQMSLVEFAMIVGLIALMIVSTISLLQPGH